MIRNLTRKGRTNDSGRDVKWNEKGEGGEI